MTQPTVATVPKAAATNAGLVYIWIVWINPADPVLPLLSVLFGGDGIDVSLPRYPDNPEDQLTVSRT